MTARLRSWWQKMKQHPFIAAGIIVAIFIAFTIAAYKFGWDWTGFNSEESQTIRISTSKGTTTAGVVQPAKSLWDWLQLLGVLAIPVVVGLGAAWFTTRQAQVSEAENKDNQREAALQAYIDKISELLLEKHLRESKPEDEVRRIARVRTLTVLPRLDARRKRSVLQFLYESGLMDKGVSIINLRGADLSGADLSDVDLRGAELIDTNLRDANLSGANLSGADLTRAHLAGTNLRGANLSGADLTRAHLAGTNLWAVNLSEAHLSRANLSGAYMWRANLHKTIASEADLSGAYLTDADLTDADLSGAYLTDAKLPGANFGNFDLREANFSRANLSGANLRKAIATSKQLAQANSLHNTIMPDGTTYITREEVISLVRGKNISDKVDLSRRNLERMNLSGFDLSGANLNRANLSSVNLVGANLREADLRAANLFGANLSNTDLFGADLREADLRATDLRGAKGTEEQLIKAKSLQGATMPDGSMHP